MPEWNVAPKVAQTTVSRTHRAKLKEVRTTESAVVLTRVVPRAMSIVMQKHTASVATVNGLPIRKIALVPLLLVRRGFRETSL
jgi:hypothetical protein